VKVAIEGKINKMFEKSHSPRNKNIPEFIKVPGSRPAHIVVNYPYVKYL